jgi:glycosyltransferase involved in cell wall biosynthesis
VSDLLLYGGFPLGFHNPESERKALAFQAAGYRVHYAAGVGIRDPRPSRLTKTLGYAGQRLRPSRLEPVSGPAPALVARPLLVLPGRRIPVVGRVNRSWLRRQIRSFLPDTRDAVFWVRFPSPEFVDLLDELAPRVLIYECVDAMHLTPGIEVQPWSDIYERAERALVARCDAVVVPHAALGQRFASWGADVRTVPHGVEMGPLGVRPRVADGPTVVGFVGTLDRRIDATVVRAIAEAEPNWRIRLIGPVAEGFDPGAFRDLFNVSIEAPIAHDSVASVLAEFDLGVMPYFDHPMYRGMSPLKNLELLAAGVPAVARPAPALEPFRDVIRMADSPAEFVSQLRAARAADNPGAARSRRARAEGRSWSVNHATLIALLDEFGGEGG